MRRSMPDSALPAPTSHTSVTPCPAIQITLSRQRTAPVICSTSNSRRVSASTQPSARTLGTTVVAGAAKATSARAARITSAAGAISAQWKGADTGNITARLAPLAFAISQARSTAALWPDTTTCAGSLSLAAWQTSPSAASAATAVTASKSRPNTAAIAPTPTGTASCIAVPRMRSKRAVSAMLRTPAAQSAEYSPSEWPATKDARSMPTPSASSARIAAIDVAIIAGCAFWVSVSVSRSPSQIRSLSFSPSAASTSSKTARAAG
mmetsp:Transcript_9440/g.15675  ORF Transcript_9440/g.15675 Transcript_9440/m.15675 type:complete len:265 (-) Transcript_9440:90-884(-)